MIDAKKEGNFWSYPLRAENETRTRDPDLGKVVLYQLSYFRVGNAKVMLFFERANFSSIFFQSLLKRDKVRKN